MANCWRSARFSKARSESFWGLKSMFKISLKEEYHPDSVQEDYLIEDILQRAFAAQRLIRQESVLDYDYAALINKWGTASKKER